MNFHKSQEPSVPGEADHGPRPAQLLWVDGEADPALPPVHPPPPRPAEGDAARPRGPDGPPAGPHHPRVPRGDAQREEARVRADCGVPREVARGRREDREERGNEDAAQRGRCSEAGVQQCWPGEQFSCQYKNSLPARFLTLSEKFFSVTGLSVVVQVSRTKGRRLLLLNDRVVCVTVTGRPSEGKPKISAYLDKILYTY